MTSTRCARCLVVDTDPLLRWTLVRFLEKRCLEARSAASGELALALLQEWPVDFLIAEVHLAGRDTPELVKRCQDFRPRPGIILIRGDEVSDLPPNLDGLGVLGMIEKPLILGALAEILDRDLREPRVPAA